jgi:hypothetical protein
MTAAKLDDTTILARWEVLGGPPMPIATNARDLVWTMIVDRWVRIAVRDF